MRYFDEKRHIFFEKRRRDKPSPINMDVCQNWGVSSLKITSDFFDSSRIFSFQDHGNFELPNWVEIEQDSGPVGGCNKSHKPL